MAVRGIPVICASNPYLSYQLLIASYKEQVVHYLKKLESKKKIQTNIDNKLFLQFFTSQSCFSLLEGRRSNSQKFNFKLKQCDNLTVV